MQFIAAPLTAGVLQFSLKPPKTTSKPLKPSQTTSKHLKASQTTSLFLCLALHLSDDLRLREAVWSNYKPYQILFCDQLKSLTRFFKEFSSNLWVWQCVLVEQHCHSGPCSTAPAAPAAAARHWLLTPSCTTTTTNYFTTNTLYWPLLALLLLHQHSTTQHPLTIHQTLRTEKEPKPRLHPNFMWELPKNNLFSGYLYFSISLLYKTTSCIIHEPWI